MVQVPVMPLDHGHGIAQPLRHKVNARAGGNVQAGKRAPQIVECAVANTAGCQVFQESLTVARVIRGLGLNTECTCPGVFGPCPGKNGAINNCVRVHNTRVRAKTPVFRWLSGSGANSGSRADPESRAQRSRLQLAYIPPTRCVGIRSSQSRRPAILSWRKWLRRVGLEPTTSRL